VTFFMVLRVLCGEFGFGRLCAFLILLFDLDVLGMEGRKEKENGESGCCNNFMFWIAAGKYIHYTYIYVLLSSAYVSNELRSL
jgi:hypothetical protein